MDCSMVDELVVFCHVIFKVYGHRLAIVVKLSLHYVAAELVDFHVHCLPALICYAAANHSQHCCVICLHWDGGLLVPHYLECVACWDGFPVVDE